MGLRVSGIISNATYTLYEKDLTSVYCDIVPSLSIDGAFADWSSLETKVDGDNDVTRVRSGAMMNENVDLREYAVNVDSALSFLLEVDGRMLGGEDIPTFRKRPLIYPTFIDSDKDTVPDHLDPLPYDFNNDNLSDAETAYDVDGDGIADYPIGMDYWLNTTIPSYFPGEYANATVSLYIGPFELPELMGMDRISILIDADNASTGLPVLFLGRTFGMDYLIGISGRNGIPRRAILYQYVGGNTPWAMLQGIDKLALDTNSMELSIPLSSLPQPLESDFFILLHITDWEGSTDVSDQPAGRSGGSTVGTRSPAGDNVVLNEVYPIGNTGEWVELANPTDSSINLNNWEIQIRDRGKWKTIYTFGDLSIGAWLSGDEYLAIDLPSNSIPDRPIDIRLVDSTGVTVDATKIPRLRTGQSWARFKAGTDGKPEDTDDDKTDWYVSTAPTKGKPNDRHRPRITVEKSATANTAAPGDTFDYVIYYNNTGGGIAKDVWINDTLPSVVTFKSSSEPYEGVDGNTYRWYFTNVAPGSSNSFTITVQVKDGVQDGTIFNNYVDLNYTDVFRAPMEWSSSNKTMVIVRPVIVVVKIADRTDAGPGEDITYTIYYNNSGNGTAAHVWVNDTIPIYTTFKDSSEPYESQQGLTYSWHFTDVGPGDHSFTITVTVNDTAPDGVLLTNWAFLNYTTENEYPLEETSDSAIVKVPEFDVYFIPLLSVFVVLISWRLRGCRRGKGSTIEE